MRFTIIRASDPDSPKSKPHPRAEYMGMDKKVYPSTVSPSGFYEEHEHRWEIEIDTLEELMEFIREDEKAYVPDGSSFGKYRGFIIDSSYRIWIYDDWVE